MVFSGAALPAPYSSLEVGPLGPAGGQGSEWGCGVLGASYGFMNCPSLLEDVVSTKATHKDQQWRFRSRLVHHTPPFGPLGGPRQQAREGQLPG